MSKAKAKGTSAETAVVKYLIDNGFPYAERRALNGALDLGDITGTPALAWEVKNHKEVSHIMNTIKYLGSNESQFGYTTNY